MKIENYFFMMGKKFLWGIIVILATLLLLNMCSGNGKSESASLCDGICQENDACPQDCSEDYTYYKYSNPSKDVVIYDYEGSNEGQYLSKSYWNRFKALDVAQTNDEWGPPQEHPQNTGGNEEGTHISLDGKELFFIYTNIDNFRNVHYGEITVSGPIRDLTDQCTHPLLPSLHTCGKWIRADTFTSKFVNGEWQEALPHPLTTTGPIGGPAPVGNKLYFMAGFEDSAEGIGYAEYTNGEWGEKIKIDVVNSEYSDSDPFVTETGDELFFASRRPAAYKGNNVYHSVNVNGEWQAPELLPEQINSDQADSMVYIYRDEFYFASGRDPRYSLAIFKTTRLGPSEYAKPELVVWSKNGLGEMSLTGDGQTMYFEQVFRDDNNNFNTEMMYIERK